MGIYLCELCNTIKDEDWSGAVEYKGGLVCDDCATEHSCDECEKVIQGAPVIHGDYQYCQNCYNELCEGQEEASRQQWEYQERI